MVKLLFGKGYQGLFSIIIRFLPIYYKHIDNLPVYNWFKIMNGQWKYLYKIRIPFIPLFFGELIVKMVYQFEKLDLTLLRKKADYQVMLSMAIRQNNKQLKFNADILASEIKKIEESMSNNEATLNGFLDYIELTFNDIGGLDPKKISTSRAFSLYHKAVERNKQLNSQYAKMKNTL